MRCVLLLIVALCLCRDYAAGLFGKADVEELLGMGMLHYGTNVDVTLYEDGQRQTLNGQGVAGGLG